MIYADHWKYPRHKASWLTPVSPHAWCHWRERLSPWQEFRNKRIEIVRANAEFRASAAAKASTADVTTQSCIGKCSSSKETDQRPR